jgi:NAD(P)-dependent dehydrogenase (short-subunit alcohol dehydrogenase family)
MDHIAVNSASILNTVQALWPKLRGGGTVCNVISNASHMPMRMSLAYNASKAAAAMMTRQIARELGPAVTVFGVSPNRLQGTPMSMEVDKQVSALRGWTWEETRQKQLEALPIGEETDPATLAEFIGFLLSNKRRHRYLHGAILEYGI